jgi:hypothetical protein
MVTIYKIENTKIKPNDDYISAELRGLSTDTKPTEVNGKQIDNGSIFIEINTGKIFFYDLENKQWNEA